MDGTDEIHYMNRLEKYIEENYDSPDRNQILHILRKREIQELDKRCNKMEKIEE
jgi:hypothetical protein